MLLHFLPPPLSLSLSPPPPSPLSLSEHHQRSSKWVRNVLYPLTFLSLLLLTSLSLLIVGSNCLSLVLGLTDLLHSNAVQDYFLGDESTSPYLGVLGTLMEVVLFMYPFPFFRSIVSFPIPKLSRCVVL